jgi:hypothetical protein
MEGGTGVKYKDMKVHITNYESFLPFPLGATAQGELWPPEQSASILLYIHPRLVF